jgi:hypothetical protein
MVYTDVLQFQGATSGDLNAYVGIAGDLFYIKNVVVKQIGAICHFRCDDGIGYQIHDDSTNKLDAVMTTTGVAHLVPKRSGYLRETHSWAASTDPKYLLSSNHPLPSGAVLREIITQATVGATISVGNSSDASGQWINAQTVTTAKKVMTLNSRIPPGSAVGNRNMYASPSTTYTGTITFEVKYDISEGTP